VGVGVLVARVGVGVLVARVGVGVGVSAVDVGVEVVRTMGVQVAVGVAADVSMSSPTAVGATPVPATEVTAEAWRVASGDAGTLVAVGGGVSVGTAVSVGVGVRLGVGVGVEV
jgi:hypothetical protein